MTDRPILFSAPMIRALLDGRKTQTRRVMKLPTKTASGGSHYERPDMGGWEPAVHGGGGCFTFGKDGQKRPATEMVGMYHGTCGTSIVTPIQKGDRLWVREAWRCNGWASDLATIFYRASEGDGYTAMCEQYPVAGRQPLRVTGSWRSSIHMPRWASRLTLYVTDVRVQRLQETSRNDAIAEGLALASNNIQEFFRWPSPHHEGLWLSPVAAYAWLWNSINGPGAWEANPWVAAYTFEAWQGNIDGLPAEIGEAA